MVYKVVGLMYWIFYLNEETKLIQILFVRYQDKEDNEDKLEV